MLQIEDISPTRSNTQITSNSSSSSPTQSVSGRMLALACSPAEQTVFAGSFSNLWVSRDGGQAWDQITWPQPPQNQFGVPGALGGWCIVDIVVSPADPQTILVITRFDREYSQILGNRSNLPDNGIWRSSDGGATWKLVFQFPGDPNVPRNLPAAGQLVWAAGSDRLVYAAGGTALAISSNGGANFNVVPKIGRINHVAAAPLVPGAPDPAMVYALGDGVMFVSIAGQPFVQDSGPIEPNWGGAVSPEGNSQAPSVLVVSPRSPLEVFLVANAPGGRTVSPAAMGGLAVSAYDNQQHFAYVGSLGVVWDAWWDGDQNRWNLQQINLQVPTRPYSRTIGSAAAGGLSVSAYHNQQHFAYVADGGMIIDAWWDGGDKRWKLQQINGPGGVDPEAPPAVGSLSVSAYKNQQHFAYVADGGMIIDAWWDGGDKRWKLQQINGPDGVDPEAPPAVGSLSVSAYKNEQHFAYVADGGIVVDAWWDGGDKRWKLQQINDPKSHAAAGGLSVSAYNNQQHFAYVDGGQTIWDSWWDGDAKQWNLQQINMGPMLWRGDYTQFFTTKRSVWEPVIPPDLWGQDEDSGSVFLATTQPQQGNLLFYGAQRPKVYVGPLDPMSASDWKELDEGTNVHVDLHGIFLSPDFRATFQNGKYQPQTGTIWLLSDGGIYRSTDGGRHFQAADKLRTLACVNVAGVALEGIGPAISLNTSDNDGFYSMDGGKTWTSQDYGGADNDCSFSDPMRPNSLLVFTPRRDAQWNYVSAADGRTVAIYETSGQLPDSRLGTARRHVVPPPPDDWNASSPFGVRGFRPIVLRLPSDVTAPGDYIFIRFKSETGRAVLLRTQNIFQIHNSNDWKKFEYGPPLPGDFGSDLGVVQAAGGQKKTTFYVGGNSKDHDDLNKLWTWTEGLDDWQALVPGMGADVARRFFVNPYLSNLIYLLDRQDVKRSDDGGATWQSDFNLGQQLTCGGLIPILRPEIDDVDVVLTDMQFDPFDSGRRFAVGMAGVFMTTDGVNWNRLLDTQAFPGRPVSCYYDWISNAPESALYVAFAERGLVKISSLP
jgi:hypothetical protein